MKGERKQKKKDNRNKLLFYGMQTVLVMAVIGVGVLMGKSLLENQTGEIEVVEVDTTMEKARIEAEQEEARKEEERIQAEREQAEKEAAQKAEAAAESVEKASVAEQTKASEPPKEPLIIMIADPETIPEQAAAEPEIVPEQAAATAKPKTPEESQVTQAETAEKPQAVTAAAGNCTEVAKASLGIDVSRYQGTIDWSQVAAAGVEFAIIRVGYRTQTTGIIFEDPCAKYNMQEAQKAGIKLGAYFFSTAVTSEEALEEAAWTTNFIAKYKITYPVAFNCEGFQESTSRQYHLSVEERTSLAVTFLDAVAAKGYTPMFYASKGEMENNNCWNMTTLAAKYKVWVSQYPPKPFPQTNASSYSGTHAMWQYTSSGTLAGISQGVDMNIAYFAYEGIAQEKDTSGAEEVEANPEVNITFAEVSETVTAKNVTNLRSVPSSKDNNTIVAVLSNGDTATRTGVGNNGWSRVVYQGQTLYAVTSYLTAVE